MKCYVLCQGKVVFIRINGIVFSRVTLKMMKKAMHPVSFPVISSHLKGGNEYISDSLCTLNVIIQMADVELDFCIRMHPVNVFGFSFLSYSCKMKSSDIDFIPSLGSVHLITLSLSFLPPFLFLPVLKHQGMCTF